MFNFNGKTYFENGDSVVLNSSLYPEINLSLKSTSFNNSISLYFHFKEELIPLFNNIVGDSLSGILSSSFYLEKVDSSFVKKPGAKINGEVISCEPYTGDFTCFKYDVFYNNSPLFINQTTQELKIPNFLLIDKNEKNIKIKLFANTIENSNISERTYLNFEFIINISLSDPSIDFSKLNSKNVCYVSANGYTIELSPSSKPGIMLVTGIVKNDSQTRLSRISYRRNDVIDGYKTLTIGSEFSFMEKDPEGNLVISPKLPLTFLFNSFLSLSDNVENKIGNITIGSVKDNVKILPFLYYGCKSSYSYSSFVIEPTIKNQIFTSVFDEVPLFNYFVKKGILSSKIDLVDDLGNDIKYIIKSFDDKTHFIYFNAEKDRLYYFLNKGFYSYVEYKFIHESHYDTYLVDGSVIFSPNIYLDKVIFSSDKTIGKVHIYKRDGGVYVKDMIEPIKIVDKKISSTDFLSSDFYAISKHHDISSFVSRIDFFDVDGKPMSVKIFNFFTNYTYNGSNTIVYKNIDDYVYFAKKTMEYDFNESDLENLSINKRYVIEDGLFLECFDGYIDFSEIGYDGFCYHDELFNFREKAKTKVYSYIVSKKHDKIVVDYFRTNFRTPGMNIETPKGVN